MAEKIIPFAHTVLLPAGSPAIGCVDAVRLDLSGIKCQYNGGACYCLGDADVLIEYHAAPLEPASLFAAPSTSGRPWQALLSLAWEMADPSGSDDASSSPPRGSYQPELRELEWFIVASNALELEGSFAITWEDPAAIQAFAAPSAAQRDDAPAAAPSTAQRDDAPDFAPASPQLVTAPDSALAGLPPAPDLTQDVEQEPSDLNESDVHGDARQEEPLPREKAVQDEKTARKENFPRNEDLEQKEKIAQNVGETALGLIWRPQAHNRVDKQGYQSFRGWTMVTYQEEDSRKQELSQELSMEQQIQQLAEKAEDTIEEAQRLWLDIEKQKKEQIMPLAENPVEENPESVPEIMTARTMPIAAERVSAMEAEEKLAVQHPEQYKELMQPQTVSLDAEQMRQVVSQSLNEEPEPDDEEDREQDLREGVVVRMRFDQPGSGNQKKFYYSGSLSEFNVAPQSSAEALQEALGEEQPQPTAKINFGWVDKATALDSPPENDEKTDLDNLDNAARLIKQGDIREKKGDAPGENERTVLPDRQDIESQRVEPVIRETLVEQSEGREEQAAERAAEQAAGQEQPEAIYDVIKTTQSQAKTTVDEKAAVSSDTFTLNAAERREAIATENDISAGNNETEKQEAIVAGNNMSTGDKAAEKQEVIMAKNATTNGEMEKTTAMADAAGAEEEAVSAKTENLLMGGIPNAKPTEAESLEAAQHSKSAAERETTKKDVQSVAGKKTALAETKSAPDAPPRVEINPQAIEEALDTALEPELLPPAEKRARRRRAVGLPCLNIDAKDNNVEISAFNLQIKL